MVQFEDLPNEILLEILNKIDNEGLINLSKTSQRFN